MSKVRTGPWVVAGVILLALACDRSDNYREDVISCEEAVAVLTDCCPGFVASRLSCFYELDASCGRTQTRRPALDLDESRCIRAKSCEELRPDICELAQQATAHITCTGDDPSNCGSIPSTSSRPPVCS